MSDITLTAQDGRQLAARAGDLFLPQRGNWTSHLILADAPDPLPSGRVTLDFHGLNCKGTILRIGTAEGQTSALIVGGAGGLGKEPDAKYYDHQIPVSLPLQEILSAVGEQLSVSSTPTILSKTLPSWPRRRDIAGHLLDTLAAAAGALWRVLPDGGVFFGQDAFAPQQLLDAEWTLLHTDPEWSMQELAPLKGATLLPGVTFGLGRVGRVHYEDDGERFVARVWYLDADGVVDDPVVAGLRGIVREELAPTAYYPLFGGQVVTQRGDGTLDVQMDDRRLPPLTSVPYLVPVPGAALDVTPGARVQVAFAGGDPRRPVAQIYESGSGTKPIGIDGDQVNCGTLLLNVTGGGMAPAVLAGKYTDPFGAVTMIASTGTNIPLKGKLIGSGKLKHP